MPFRYFRLLTHIKCDCSMLFVIYLQAWSVGRSRKEWTICCSIYWSLAALQTVKDTCGQGRRQICMSSKQCHWCSEITPEWLYVIVLYLFYFLFLMAFSWQYWCYVSSYWFKGLCLRGWNSYLDSSFSCVVQLREIIAILYYLLWLFKCVQMYCMFWGTGIRGLRGTATLPQTNQELLVVRDKVGRPQVSLG